MKVKTQCHACEGTGIYVGFAEKNGAGVVCTTCNGTGMKVIKYTPFSGRVERKDVKRVYYNCPYGISAIDSELDGKKFPFSKFGCSYDDWLKGVKPKQITFLGCPLYMNQGACHDVDGFVERCDELNGGWLSDIRACKNNVNKSECWKLFNSKSK